MTDTSTGSWINDRTVYLTPDLIDYSTHGIKESVASWLDYNTQGWNFSYYSSKPLEQQYILAFEKVSHAVHFKLRWEGPKVSDGHEEIDCDDCYF